MKVSESVEALKGVGPALAKKLAKLDVHTIQDLILYYPRRYDDFSDIKPITQLHPGPVTIKAKIKQAKGRYVRGGLHITEAVASDETSSVRLIWFNQPYREKAIKKDQEYFISGSLELKRMKFAINNPSMELVSDFPVNTARIIPIYKEHKTIKSGEIRKAIREAFDTIEQVETVLPPEIETKHTRISRKQALEQIHFPDSTKDFNDAKERIGFEEIFELMVANLLAKKELQTTKALEVKFNKQVAQDMVAQLPFELTSYQKATTWEIYQDIAKPTPMNRLLEGDVGSGKTAVASMAAVMCVEQGYQVALMAPTELLARQHAETLLKLLQPLGHDKTVCLLVGGMKAQQKELALWHIREGKAKLIVGTHALIEEKVKIDNLALAIVDEQHRFGVEQRKKLLKKTGHMPHMLSMTATPIPRSLALTLYGEMEISIIKSKPKNRTPIETELVRPSAKKRLHQNLKKKLASGEQMFVVCPLITPNDMLPAMSVEEAFEIYKKEYKQYKVAVLHGKQKPEDKQKTMQDFVEHKIDILVSTTVIEVGVDVPNATVMLIESPERFGLAQIHQLRGRVGRGEKQGYCYLLLSEDKAPSKRLLAVSQTNDGFRLSELDLELRGPGAIYGSMQHGALDFRMVNITDLNLIKKARVAAEECVNNSQKMLQYRPLQKRIKELQKITHLN